MAITPEKKQSKIRPSPMHNSVAVPSLFDVTCKMKDLTPLPDPVRVGAPYGWGMARFFGVASSMQQWEGH